jgi:hypothetical protein
VTVAGESRADGLDRVATGEVTHEIPFRREDMPGNQKPQRVGRPQAERENAAPDLPQRLFAGHPSRPGQSITDRGTEPRRKSARVAHFR